MKQNYNSINWSQLVYYAEDSVTFLRYKMGNDSFGKSKRYKNDVAGSIRVGRYGYLRYNNTNYVIHRIVWILLNGPIPDGMVVNHKDCSKGNNHILNLELRTQRENLILNKTAVHGIRRTNAGNTETMLSEQYTTHKGKRYYSVRLQYLDGQGKKKTKAYSYNKYGKERAWALARELKTQVETYARTIQRGENEDKNTQVQ